MPNQSYFDVIHANKSSSTPLSSVNSSFSSDSGWNTCSMVNTPCTPNMFYDSGFSINSSEPSSLTTNHFNGALLQPTMGLNTFAIPVYHEPELYASHNGLPSSAQVGNGYHSPMCSPQEQNCLHFVTPLETTFNPNNGMQSPFRSNVIIEPYDSPSSDYQTEFSFNDSPMNSLNGSVDYSMSPCSSVGYTPSPSSPVQSEKFELRLPARSPSSQSSVKLEVLETSAALQGVQNMVPRTRSARRIQAKTQQRKAKAVRSEKKFPENFAGNNLKRFGSRKHACNVLRCEKRFERTEHVKRHESTVHNPLKFACPFCPAGREKYFPKGRMDNYKDHLKRHTIANKTRTNYHRDAQAELNSLNSKSGKRTKKSELIGNVKTAIEEEMDGGEEVEVMMENEVLP